LVLVPGHTCFDARGCGCSVRVPTRCPSELRPRWSVIRDFQHGLKSTLEADELLRRRWYAARSFSATRGSSACIRKGVCFDARGFAAPSGPLVVCHYHRQYLVMSVLLVTHYRQTGITCGVLCSLFDEAEPDSTLEATAAPSGFCVALYSQAILECSVIRGDLIRRSRLRLLRQGLQCNQADFWLQPLTQIKVGSTLEAKAAPSIP
jgi:hypothetical protein